MNLLVSACQCCGETLEVPDFDEPRVCGDCQRWLEDDSPRTLVAASTLAEPAARQ